MEKVDLGREIYKVSNIKGRFLLRSGKYSNEYFDKYLFESNPRILNEIADHLSQMIPKDIDALAGLEMGGIPVATAISLKTKIPSLYVRKKAKEYCTCKLAEGGDIESKKIVIIEDVITSGGAVLDAVESLRTLGAKIDSVFCVIDREDTGKENLKQAGLRLHALFTKSELIPGQQADTAD
jgi:orotate phosphoribosyltransferase